VVGCTQLGSLSAHGTAGEFASTGETGGGMDGSVIVGSGAVVVSAGTVVSAGCTVPVLAGSTAGSSRRSQAATPSTSTAQSRGIRMAFLHGGRTCGRCMNTPRGFGRRERHAASGMNAGV